MPWFTDDSCAASQPPTEATTTLRQRHTPHLGLLTLEVVPQASLVGLVDRLSADPQGVPDLGPGSPVTACCHGQQIACVGQRILGVSHLPKSLQRPLRSPQVSARPSTTRRIRQRAWVPSSVLTSTDIGSRHRHPGAQSCQCRLRAQMSLTVAST